MITYILGAGPAGMAVVDGLIDAKAGNFIVLEKEPHLGGLAQTLDWEGVGSHDLGPHKIFSLDRGLIYRIESLLESNDWLIRNKISSIYMRGNFLPYPPSVFSLVGVFGFSAFFCIAVGYSSTRLVGLFNSLNPRTFEEDLVNRLGEPLYKLLFKPIAEKLWGNPRELDVKLSRGRIQTPSLFEVLVRLFKLKKDSSFEAFTFRYPKGGLRRLWTAIEEKAKGSGQFLLGHTVTGLVAKNGRIQEIGYQTKDRKGVFHVGADDFVVSTLPLAFATNLLRDSLPPHIPELVNKVVNLNDLLLVFLYIDRPSLIDESWIFIPDPKIIFHRLSEQESFDSNMTPNGSIVCCEIMSSISRTLTHLSDEQLCEATTGCLFDMGYSGFKILGQRVIRLPQSYPVLRKGFEIGLAEIIQALDGLHNFRTLGRQGTFNYIGTLDAMDIGYGFAKWLIGGRRQLWQQERERTNHYPVLD